MDELMNQTDKTPIEVFLAVDEDGKTSARKVYKFLGLADGQFVRWAKTNITENKFAVENEDYVRVDIDVETPTGGIIQREDYKLTATFAKKICMTSHTQQGEEARNYFIKVEEKLKEIAILNQQQLPKDPMSILKLTFKSLEGQAQEIQYIKSEVKDLRDNAPLFAVECDEISNTVKRCGVILLGGKNSNAYQDRGVRTKVYKDIYNQLYRQFGVNSHKAIKRCHLELAKKIIHEYSLPIVLSEEINMVNSQITFTDVSH
ncbi:ORF6C domain-containing protein [Bacillus sp. NPDC077411]|uniref:ORF6C domain-containing protein n=1 Tax=Bacillus sp. NPDC077411 TaxID=3363947 RepID=UPI0037C78C5C